METKAAIRKRALERRDGLPATIRQEYSRRIREALCELDIYRQAEWILGYVSFRSEVDTITLLEEALRQGKKVCCPKVFGGRMDFYRIHSLTELKKGYMGIPEPEGREEKCFPSVSGKEWGGLLSGEEAAIPALMLMPGAAFDENGRRIGYGRGYYDRYLSAAGEAGCQKADAGYGGYEKKCFSNSRNGSGLFWKVGLAFSVQMEKEIPEEPHDVPLDMIITETKHWHF